MPWFLCEFGDGRLPARFWKKVRPVWETGCWEWTASKCAGYGQIGTFENGKHQPKRAYAFAYNSIVGHVPAGLQIDHLCCNKACVNPAHLEAVTPAENLRRAAQMGLHKRANFLRSFRVQCKRGHDLCGDNVVINAKGRRSCRACKDAAAAKQKAKNEADAAEFKRTGIVKPIGKKACPKGHPYKGDNIGVNSRGYVFCQECHRACARDYARRKYVRKRPNKIKAVAPAPRRLDAMWSRFVALSVDS